MNSKCIICKNQRFTVINSLKHHWKSCNKCGTIIRISKNETIIQKILPSFLINLLPSYITNLITIDSHNNDNCLDTYKYYADICVKGEKGFENTKWDLSKDQVLTRLDRLKIPYKNKQILIISGGPGHHACELQKRDGIVTVTEFNIDSVRAMQDFLGLNTIKFDYNTDSLREVFYGKKFDLIIIDYSIVFCLNLKKFISEISMITRQSGFVYISYTLPTVGSCIRWQFDDYPCYAFYSDNIIKKMFEKCNFIVTESDCDYKYRFNFIRGIIPTRGIKMRRLFMDLLSYPYFFYNLSNINRINYDLKEYCIYSIFQKH